MEVSESDDPGLPLGVLVGERRERWIERVRDSSLSTVCLRGLNDEASERAGWEGGGVWRRDGWWSVVAGNWWE